MRTARLCAVVVLVGLVSFQVAATSVARDEPGPPPPGYVTTGMGFGVTVLKPPRALPCTVTPQGVRRPRIWFGVRFGHDSAKVGSVTASVFAPTGVKSTGKRFRPQRAWHYVSLHLRRGHEHPAPNESCGGTWTVTYTINSEATTGVRHSRRFSFTMPNPA